jgi:hypothetical protein
VQQALGQQLLGYEALLDTFDSDSVEEQLQTGQPEDAFELERRKKKKNKKKRRKGGGGKNSHS